MDTKVIESPEFATAALKGLNSEPKWLDSKWLYDARGSELFEQITQLPEYYPTRTETGILKREVGTLSRYIKPGSALVELGSGASIKTRILLDALPSLSTYVPVDISAEFLNDTAAVLKRRYPDLDIQPVVADFTGAFATPAALGGMAKTAFFPGSTIGNLPHDAAARILGRIREWPGIEALILGVDLVKDRDVLLRAYDDSAGVTAAFNMNLLRRMNREIAAGFNLMNFQHEARWNDARNRIEMHLVSDRDQTIPVAGQTIRFGRGETIHTENSRKYTEQTLGEIAAGGGWQVTEFLTDPDRLFAVAVLTPSRRG